MNVTALDPLRLHHPSTVANVDATAAAIRRNLHENSLARPETPGAVIHEHRTALVREPQEAPRLPDDEQSERQRETEPSPVSATRVHLSRIGRPHPEL